LARRPKYRSGFEGRVAARLPQCRHEPLRLPYVLHNNYLPDFVDEATRTIYEAKGRFTGADRRKMLAVARQHPDWRIVMVLQAPDRRISKSSRTTYAAWCEKNGLEWTTVEGLPLSNL
jgi:hypothetical protein